MPFTGLIAGSARTYMARSKQEGPPMAYLYTRADLLEGLAATISPDVALTPLELRTLQLSQADGRATLRAPRRIERLGALLFGSKRVSGLANARLEALRRFAILYRLDGMRIDSGEITRAEEAGLSAAMLLRVRVIVDGWPRKAGPLLRAAGLIAGLGVAAVAAVTGYLWLAHELEPMVAAILLGALAVTLAPLFAGGVRH
jgi:hypothetical protein